MRDIKKNSVIYYCVAQISRPLYFNFNELCTCKIIKSRYFNVKNMLFMVPMLF